jgi:protein ImuB
MARERDDATAPRTCCVWCPDWPVVAARRRDRELRGVPVVVLERVGSRHLVRAASTQARVEGVTRGMRRREAEACCGELVCVDADEALEARAFEIVARAVETMTPRVVLDRPGLCAFPTRGPSRYFGGDDALAVRVRDVVSEALDEGDEVNAGGVCIGIADGAFTARLAARTAARARGDGDGLHVVAPRESAAFLAPWPVVVFDDDELASLLVRLGLPTLGAVAALPATAMVARFGIDGQRFHDLAHGRDPGPPVLVTPPPDLVEQIELDPPAARVDIAAFAAKGLADRLLERLAERGLACTRVVVEAETEHGERLARCWRHARGSEGGALTPATLAERVRWQLDAWLAAANEPSSGADDLDVVDSTTGGLILLRLVPAEVVPADGRQLGFWGGDQVALDRADRALARVQGMVGHAAVATAVLQGGRTPAEQVRWVPWGDPREPERPLAVGTEIPAWPGALPAPFPARVIDPPVPAQLCDADAQPVTVSGRGEQSAPPDQLWCAALPGGGGRIRGWAGPWAHDVRWWDARARQRCVRWQVIVECGDAGDVACIVALEGGRAGVEAIYD